MKGWWRWRDVPPKAAIRRHHMRRCTSGSSTTRPGAKGCDSSSDEEMMYHSMTERPPRRRQPSSCGSHCLQAGRTVLPLLFLVALACSTLAYFAGAAYIRSHAAAAIVIDTNSDNWPGTVLFMGQDSHIKTKAPWRLKSDAGSFQHLDDDELFAINRNKLYII